MNYSDASIGGIKSLKKPIPNSKNKKYDSKVCGIKPKEIKLPTATAD